MPKNRFLEVPHFLKDAAEHRRRLAVATNQAISGKLNCTGTVTLTPNVTSTIITDPRVSVDSCVLLMPTTANAAAEFGVLYITITQNGQFTIYHNNYSTTDRDFVYAIIG